MSEVCFKETYSVTNGYDVDEVKEEIHKETNCTYVPVLDAIKELLSF